MKEIKKREIHGGIQKIYKFKNKYGASVVRHSFSYGHEQGLWELAVIKWNDDETWDITFETPITNDVLGHLSLRDVDNLLNKIKNLPRVKD